MRLGSERKPKTRNLDEVDYKHTKSLYYNIVVVDALNLISTTISMYIRLDFTIKDNIYHLSIAYINFKNE